MTALFVDSSVFLIAVGGDHPDRDECRSFLAEAAQRAVRLHASVETVQEFLFHRLRRYERATALREAKVLAASCILHPFDVDVLDEAIRLVEDTQIRGRDAVHAATAGIAGFDAIVSLDTDFDGLAMLRRVHPAAAFAG